MRKLVNGKKKGKDEKKKKPKKYEHWYIVLYENPVFNTLPELIRYLDDPNIKGTEIKSPPGVYYADPFMIENHLFFEEYRYKDKTKKNYKLGIISLLNFSKLNYRYLDRLDNTFRNL